jgi:hypothetical protein
MVQLTQQMGKAQKIILTITCLIVSTFFAVLIIKQIFGENPEIKLARCKSISEDAVPSGIELQNLIKTVNNSQWTPDQRKQIAADLIKQYKDKVYQDCLK